MKPATSNLPRRAVVWALGGIIFTVQELREHGRHVAALGKLATCMLEGHVPATVLTPEELAQNVKTYDKYEATYPRATRGHCIVMSHAVPAESPGAALGNAAFVPAFAFVPCQRCGIVYGQKFPRPST